MKVGRELCPTNNIKRKTTGGSQIVQVLGSIMIEDGQCSIKYERKYLEQKMQTNKLSIQVKMHITKTVMWSVLLYGSETWTLSK